MWGHGRDVVVGASFVSSRSWVADVSQCVLGDVPAHQVMCELERSGVVEPNTLPAQLCCFATSGTPVEVFSWLVPESVDAVQVNCNILATYFIKGESGKNGAIARSKTCSQLIAMRKEEIGSLQ